MFINFFPTWDRTQICNDIEFLENSTKLPWWSNVEYVNWDIIDLVELDFWFNKSYIVVVHAHLTYVSEIFQSSRIFNLIVLVYSNSGFRRGEGYGNNRKNSSENFFQNSRKISTVDFLFSNHSGLPIQVHEYNLLKHKSNSRISIRLNYILLCHKVVLNTWYWFP